MYGIGVDPTAYKPCSPLQISMPEVMVGNTIEVVNTLIRSESMYAKIISDEETVKSITTFLLSSPTEGETQKQFILSSKIPIKRGKLSSTSEQKHPKTFKC